LKAIEILLKQFEGFIKRAVMPSVSFIFIFLVELSIFSELIKDGETKDFLLYENFNNEHIIFMFVVLIGFSYFLSILNQLVFDNFIKENYNGIFLKKENDLLKNLRKEVIKKLKNKMTYIDENYSDYFLYQAVSRELAYFNKPTDTTRYVDDTKSIGIFFLSLVLVNIIFISLIFSGEIFNIVSIIILLILSILVIFIGFEAIKAKYRSRAIRIYVNYLLDEKVDDSTTSERDNFLKIKILDN